MIKLTRRDNQAMILNPDLIETIEETPDTVITLTNGRRHLVSESSAQIIERILEYKASILCKWSSLSANNRTDAPEQSAPECIP
ncbi:MAG: flagellar FlbD family protein [Desulfobulbaceae bacterium]|nr:flagellar FlbD family protein [Desulfobulbaceae bacterium]